MTAKFTYAIATILLAIVAIAPAQVQAQNQARTQRGEHSFGPRVGFTSRNRSAVAGLEFQYSFSRHLRIAPEIDIVFRNNNKDALMVNLDFQFPVAMSTKASFYPLAGINYTSWGLHDLDIDSQKDVTTHTNCFGLNAGAGVEVKLTPSLKIGLEAKYNLIRHYPGLTATAGIAYVF